MERFLEITEKPERIFAIGDIHGCADELGILLYFLEQELGICERDRIIFIGDYIDRGPDSKGVIDSLLAFQKNHGEYTVFLKGNHEDMLLDFIGFDGQNGGVYVSNGGAKCLESYAIDEYTPGEEVRELLPARHVKFFKSLDRYAISENHVYVHAGLSPIIDLKHQEDEHIFWIRDEFIHNIHYFEKTVVFGHTPFEDLLFHLPYKIGIDTGLVYGNTLSCIEVLGQNAYQLGYGDSFVRETSFEEKGAIFPELGVKGAK